MPQLINTLSWWQWLIFAAVPPAIVLLYFLKLKRRPIEVPSTYLWHRSIEDLHVNTIWQRLRRNLLLLLQLLLLALAALALLRPGWQGVRLEGNRFIFLIDASASMQAEDEKPSRLGAAKQKALELVNAMHSGDVGMVVSFADTARVEQMFTDNRPQLRRSIEAIQPTVRRTSLAEALKVAAGLANPGQANRLSDALPATMMIFSDGNFDQPSAFALGHLAPVYVPVGKGQAKNVAITAFSIRRHESKAGQLQAFARLANFGSEEATVSLELRLDGQLIDASKVTVSARGDSSAGRDAHPGVAAGANSAAGESAEVSPGGHAGESAEVSPGGHAGESAEVSPGGHAGESAEVSPGGHAGESVESPGGEQSPGRRGVVFDLGDVDAGVLSLKIATTDDLALDNEAWAVVNLPRRAKVLLVTPGNEPLEIALNTTTARQLAELTVESPGFLDKESYQQQAAGGGYDLVIYDRCQPKTMPQANTLFLGAMPPRRTWKARPKVTQPQIIDVDPTHPLTRWLSLGDVVVAEATPLVPPPGATVLIDSHLGPLLAVAPREAFEDAVLGFVFIDEIVGKDGQRQSFIGSNWPIRPSFPVFTLNILQYLGGGQARSPGRQRLARAGSEPGEPLSGQADPGPRAQRRRGRAYPSQARAVQLCRDRRAGRLRGPLGRQDLPAFRGQSLQHRGERLASSRRVEHRPSGSRRPSLRRPHRPPRALEVAAIGRPGGAMSGMVYLSPPGLFVMLAQDMPTSASHPRPLQCKHERASDDRPGFHHPCRLFRMACRASCRHAAWRGD